MYSLLKIAHAIPLCFHLIYSLGLMPPVFYVHLLQCNSKLPKTRKLNVRVGLFKEFLSVITLKINSTISTYLLVLLQTLHGTGRDWHANTKVLFSECSLMDITLVDFSNFLRTIIHNFGIIWATTCLRLLYE